jgi:hypothetical protein
LKTRISNKTCKIYFQDLEKNIFNPTTNRTKYKFSLLAGGFALSKDKNKNCFIHILILHLNFELNLKEIKKNIFYKTSQQNNENNFFDFMK